MKKQGFFKRKKYPANFFIVDMRRQSSSLSPQKKFIPFVRERDGLGRLIKSPSSQPKQSKILPPSIRQFTQQNISKYRDLVEMRVETVQSNINRQFQYREPIKVISNQHNSIKIKTRLNSPIKIERTQQAFSSTLYTWQDYDRFVKVNPTALERYSSLREKCETRLNTEVLPRQLSMRQNRVKKSQQPIKKDEQKPGFISNSSKIIIMKNKTANKQKRTFPLKSTKLKQQKNIMELKRYQTSKALSLKLFQDIHEKNDIFYQKMLESKKLSFQIKMNLEAT